MLFQSLVFNIKLEGIIKVGVPRTINKLLKYKSNIIKDGQYIDLSGMWEFFSEIQNSTVTTYDCRIGDITLELICIKDRLQWNF